LQNGISATITVTIRVEQPKISVLSWKVAATQPDLNKANNIDQLTIRGFTEASIDPNMTTTLTYTDTETGRPINVSIPDGAITQPLTLRYTIAATRTSPINLIQTGNAFHLDAYDGASPLDNITFLKGVTVTLHYDDNDLSEIDEENILLYFWDVDTSSWQEAACGEYTRNLTENWLSVPICHLTEFALFGQSNDADSHRIYLPVVINK
jgi:hypothetical protein